MNKKYAKFILEANAYVEESILGAKHYRDIIELQVDLLRSVVAKQRLCGSIDFPVIASDEFYGSAFARRHQHKALFIESIEPWVHQWGEHHTAHGATLLVANHLSMLEGMELKGLSRYEANIHAEQKLQEKRIHLGELLAADYPLDIILEEDRRYFGLFSSVNLDGLMYAAHLNGMPYYRGSVTVKLALQEDAPKLVHFLKEDSSFRTVAAMEVEAGTLNLRSVDTEDQIMNELLELLWSKQSCLLCDPNTVHLVWDMARGWRCAIVSSPLKNEKSFIFEVLLVRDQVQV